MNLSQPQAPSIPGVQNIIAISSGKGGVGKSTVSVNLASTLSMEGLRVGLLDADVYGPNLPLMMGVVDDPRIEKNAQDQEIFVPPLAHGIKVMSMGSLVDVDEPMVWRGPMLHKIIRQFAHQVNWGGLDYLIVDLPPGTGDVQISISETLRMNGVVIVTTPQEVALQDVRKAVRMWEQAKIPVLGVVENMSYFKCGRCDEKHDIFGKGGGHWLADKYATEVLAQVPLVPEIRRGGDEGLPEVIRDPSGEVAAIYQRLMTQLRAKTKRTEFAPDSVFLG